jgi:hypothetical protein
MAKFMHHNECAKNDGKIHNRVQKSGYGWLQNTSSTCDNTSMAGVLAVTSVL